MSEEFDSTAAVRSTASRAGFAQAAGWATALNAGRQVFALLIGFVLAGILGPDAYGVLAMALVYIAFLEMLQRQGLIGAVIQRQDLDRHHANAAFWLVMGTSAVLTVASVLAAGWWATLNRTPELQGVIIALSAVLPLQGLNVVQEALLRRSLRFRELTLRTTSAVVAGGVGGIAAAVAGWGVWALVVQQLVTALWSTVALWAISDWRPGFRFTRRSVRDLLGFSTGTLLSALGLFLNARADVLVSGLILGPVTVGLYRFAARLIDAVISLSGQSAAALALPDLAPFQLHHEEFVRRVKRLSRMAGALALPALGVLFGAAEVVIATLGSEWAPATAGLKWLCVYGVIRTLAALTGPVMQAKGRTFVQALFAWSMAVVSLSVFTVTALHVSGSSQAQQVAAVASSRAVVFGAVLLSAHLLIMWRIAGMGPWASLQPFGTSLISGAVGAAGASLLVWLLPTDNWPVAGALLVCGVAGSSAIALLGVIDKGARQLLLESVRKARTGRG